METERIDGAEYVVNTPEWQVAKAARAARMDAAFVESDFGQGLVERHLRRLSRMDAIEGKFDANQTAFLARDLVFKRAAIERTIFDQNRAAQLIPIEGGHPEGAMSYATRRWNQRGEAAFSTDLNNDTVPRADVTLEEDLQKYVNVKGSYGFTVQDLERAAYSGTPLPMEKALALAEMIGRGLDQIGRSGTFVRQGESGLYLNKIGLTGLFNHPDVPITTLAHGAWDTNTVTAQIIQDFAQLEQAIIAASRDNQPTEGYRLLVPTAVDANLALLQLPNTILNLKNYLLQNARLIKSIDRWVKLDDASSPLVRTTKKSGVVYPMDLRTLFWPYSVAYQELAPQIDGFEYLIHGYARCGGVEVRRPFEMTYVEALTA
jgi:hypothetical protein